ncbi:MAG: DNA polymerase/3'-5' exonuclease PolX [Actinobacteria bacterium]|nr:DNA polymerase/3'-5' exonuclease PolX [Actinomycetota bacterium]MBU4490193.1 DNA polymerase/3'-5' exonuclease PolX [Actinomycetota bacterium]
MTAENTDIARIFDQVADLLEVNGAGYYRVRAYRNASRVIRDLSTPLHVIAASKDRKLEDLPGIGRDLAGRIREILETGDLALMEDLEAQLPGSLLEVMKVPGLGPRKTHELFLELGVTSLDTLEEATGSGKVRRLKGFGPKTERKILEGIHSIKGPGRRFFRSEAEVYALSILEHMSAVPGLKRIEVAGSYRRLAETVGNLDVLVACGDTQAAIELFEEFAPIARVIATGPTGSSVVIDPGIQVGMRVVDEDSFGASLLRFTGSKAHVLTLGRMALERGLKLNENGVFREGKKAAGRTEEEVYAALGLPWIPPELRENRGEIRLAMEGLLPDLVNLEDIRGDLHIHTDATDGKDSLQDMVAEARRRKYLFLAITNHSKRVPGGLDGRALLGHWRQVERLDAVTPGIHLLKGVEVDILPDGSLDLEDTILARADYVVVAVHYDTEMSPTRMTGRVVRAINHPLVDTLAHPTGRRINKNPPYGANLEDIVMAAGRAGTCLELNAAPNRLDIDDLACRLAHDHGVKISIATDAHSLRGLDFMKHGINQARRGWLEKGDVLNARTYRSLSKLLNRRRPA